MSKQQYCRNCEEETTHHAEPSTDISVGYYCARCEG